MAERAAVTVLQPGADGDRVIALLERHERVHREGPEVTVRRIVLDTFDWRVRRAGGALSWADGTLTWRDRRTGKLHVVAQGTPPRWPADVPDGPVRDLLGAACGVRSLLPRLETDRQVRRYRVLDEHDQTVARLELARGTVGGTLVASLALHDLHGGRRARERVVRRLTDELDIQLVAADPADTLCVAAGLEPGGYPGEHEVLLEPTTAANEAVARTCRHLLDLMRTNEDGLVADLDTEYLHDFRVAVRRTRSMLAVSKRIFPSDVRADFRVRFKWLGDVTTPVRDLDVFALAIPDLARAAAGGDLEVLRPLADLVAADRQERHAALLAALRSQNYADLVGAWSATLDQPPTDNDTIEAHAAIIDVARQRIWRAYRVVRRRGRAIDGNSPPPVLHQLRKDAKQLRYVLDAFGTLFDADRAERAGHELKHLQDNLGAFQDGHVQAQAIRGYAARIACRPTDVDTVMALGVVVSHLARAQEDARAQSASCFARFDRSDNRALYRELFSPKAARRRPGP